MKMLWVLLNIGLTFADKLDRTYLPPPGSIYSGGSPGAIDVPFELPETNFSSKAGEFSKEPELVIGIDRAGPYQEDNTFMKEISQPYNFNSFNSPTETAPSILLELSQFPEADKHSTPIPAVYHNADHPLNYFDNSQQFENVEKHPISSIFVERNRSYLPPYGKDIDSMKHVVSSIIPLPVNIENVLSNEYKYIQPDQLSDNQPVYDVPSILRPNYSSINMKSNGDDFTTATHIVPTNFINTIDNKKNFNKISIQKPERIKAESDRNAVIINYGQTINPDGYAYGYDTSNGISAEEEGTATNGVKGSYSYIGDDGNVYEVTYMADENGFLPKGAHLPTAPPIPDVILKVIEQAVRDKEAGVYNDGSYDEEKYGYKKYQDRYPQTNNIINSVDFASENGINIAKNDEFIENEDSQGLNKISKVIEKHYNKFENNSNSRGMPNEIQDSTQNSDLKNINIPNTNFNKNDYDLSLQQPENSLLSNEQKNYFDVTQNTDVVISDKNYNINQNKPSGYEYFAPTNAYFDTNNLQSFPPRFLGIQQDFHIESQENNDLKKVTAKPFLTPYVSRKGDESEVEDFDEGGNHKNNVDDAINSNYLQKTVEPTELLTNTDDPIKSLKFISGRKPQFGERIQNHLVSPDKEGYYYQNANKPSITLNPRVSYTPTAAPTEFPSLISTTQQVDRTSGRDQTAFQTNTTPLVVTSSTKSPISSLPTQTMSPILLDESTSVYPVAYSKSDLISTAKSAQTSRPGLLPGVPRFTMTSQPSTSIANYPDINNGVTSTESVFGEDFSGPKQPQLFDPITGYHY